MSPGRPMFSVCIPAYNHEAFIDEAITSVLTQECADVELIISDDASTDKTLERIETFHDSRIVVRKTFLTLDQRQTSSARRRLRGGNSSTFSIPTT